MRANIREKKKVPADIKRRWNSRFKKTRLADIAKGSDLNIMTVSDAISKGLATYRTIEKINKYAQELKNSNNQTAK